MAGKDIPAPVGMVEWSIAVWLTERWGIACLDNGSIDFTAE